MQRLLPHYILEFYRAANVTPINNGYLRFDPSTNAWCACALTACYLAYHPDQSPEQAFGLTDTRYFDDDTLYADIIRPWLIRQVKLNSYYLLGFVDGFDCPESADMDLQNERLDDYSEQYQIGYQDGYCAWQAVQQTGGVLV